MGMKVTHERIYIIVDYKGTAIPASKGTEKHIFVFQLSLGDSLQ